MEAIVDCRVCAPPIARTVAGAGRGGAEIFRPRFPGRTFEKRGKLDETSVAPGRARLPAPGRFLTMDTLKTGRWLVRAAAWGLFLLAVTAVRAADDPLEEIRKVSALTGMDAARLRRGEIFSERGTQGNFARGAYAESCYFVKTPVARAGDTLLHWDPSKYKETEVGSYLNYRWPALPDAFKKFQFSAARRTDRQIVDETLAAARGETGELHLRPSDLELLRGPLKDRDLAPAGARENAVSLGWQRVLQQRSEAMADGGLTAVPSYVAAGTTIRAADEVRSLLKMTPGIAARFAPLTGARPLFADSGAAADEVSPYAEQSQVNNHTSLCLGVLAARRSPGSWQVLDCSYYTADTYFVSLSLYQIWPWENGALVWQVDYVSAPFRSYLGGLDRVFASKEMSKDSAGAVRIFRREAEGQ